MRRGTQNAQRATIYTYVYIYIYVYIWTSKGLPYCDLWAYMPIPKDPSNFPTTRYPPKPRITIPNTETLPTLYLGTFDLLGIPYTAPWRLGVSGKDKSLTSYCCGTIWLAQNLREAETTCSVAEAALALYRVCTHQPCSVSM